MASTGVPAGILEYYLVLGIFVTLMVIRRVRSYLRGYKYNTSRLIRVPVIYALILLFFSSDVIFLAPPSLIQLITMTAAAVAGIVGGLFFGKSGEVFKRDDQIYFKRSVVILAIWLISFLSRLVLDLLYPTDFTVQYMVISLLAFSTGLFAGESVAIYGTYRQFAEKGSVTDTFQIQ